MVEPQVQEKPAVPESEEDSVGLSNDVVEAVREALGTADLVKVEELVQPLHPADMADLLESLTPEERELLLKVHRAQLEAEVVSYLDVGLRAEVCRTLGAKKVAAILNQLDSDDALEIFEDLPEDLEQKILSRVPATIRRLLQEGLTYPEDSAGRLMQREIVVVPQIWSVGETIDYMRSQKRKLPHDFYDLYVVDPRYKPVGKVPLSRVLRNKRPVKITDVMDVDFYPVPVAMDQEEVAYIFRQYGVVSTPVVDDAGRLVGVVTVDDVVHVIDEEAEEDILKLAGVTDTSIYADVLETARARFIWLLVNLGTAVLASLVIGLFGATIEQQVALAILMPIVASMGGNAGTQTLTVAVRAIAMKDLTGAAASRFVWKELLVGLANGLLFAVIAGGVAVLWFGDPLLGVVIGAAMVINLLIAGLAGTLIPLGLVRVGVDPAIASSVFLTTVTDVIGFFAFLGLAALVLL
ncbi:MAG: magnesium transporter [Rhodovibrionaceae bacterium]